MSNSFIACHDCKEIISSDDAVRVCVPEIVNDGPYRLTLTAYACERCVHSGAYYVPGKKELDAPLMVELDREDDGRWLALIVDMPGVNAYGRTEDEAFANVMQLVRNVTSEAS